MAMSDMYIIEEEDMSIELDEEEVAMDMAVPVDVVVIWDISIMVSSSVNWC
jgi:hypothetical protein